MRDLCFPETMVTMVIHFRNKKTAAFLAEEIAASARCEHAVFPYLQSNRGHIQSLSNYITEIYF